MLYNLRLWYWRQRYGARSGKTTRLLVARIPLDTTGWRAIGVLALVAWLLFGVQLYAAWQARPQYKALAAPVGVRLDPPIIIFQTQPPPTPLPTPLPEVREVFIDRPVYIEVPVIAPAVVQPVAPAPQAEPQPSGGNEPPAGMTFPIVNGVDATGQHVEGPSEKGSRTNTRGYK